jgi:PncC family amidohydrolase
MTSKKIKLTKYNLLSVSAAESVTAGALANALCAEPGASKYFYGGLVAYHMKTKEKFLNIDGQTAEMVNYANPLTTLLMAKNVIKMFNSRIGISTTGYSLPYYRPMNEEKNESELKIDVPYAWVCLYDKDSDFHKIIKVEYINYDKTNPKHHRAKMQTKVALEALKLYSNYCKNVIESQ